MTDAGEATSRHLTRRRFLLAWVAPPLLVLLAVLAPVILGQRTFFLRDVFSVHLELRGAVAEQAAAGTPAPPLVDPYRGGGQPLAGNPNAVAFHPTAWLHSRALQGWLPLLAAFNVHLWLHWLLAPLAFLWLARELGLGRRGAWAAAVAWGFSGFLVSQLAFYNLVAGVATAPALAAAALETVRHAGMRTTGVRETGRALGQAVAATGGLAALVLVAGDPMTAAAALVAALALAAAETRRRGGEGEADGAAATPVRSLGWLAVALAGGALLAAPQIVEMLRILPGSLRGAGFSAAMRTAGSFDPRQVVEQLLPFAFGRPDLLGDGTFWGYRFHQGSWPFYFTLYPGLAVLALFAASGRSWRLPGAAGRVGRRGWALVAAGLFFALGAFNPLVTALLALPGLDAARYPLKLWLWVAMGTALLAGVGFERLLGEAGAAPRSGPSDGNRARNRAVAVLALLAAAFTVLWALLRLAPGSAASALHAAMPPGTPPQLAASEVGRWSGLAAASVGVALLLALAVGLAARRPALGGPLLLVLHAALQVALLRPALATEPVAPYAAPPPIAAALPPSETVVHGSAGDLFGPDPPAAGDLPAPEVRWIYRRTFAEAYPFAGALWGRRYELAGSPEGLDRALLGDAASAVREAPDDAARLRLLAAWGVGRLVLGRRLDVAPPPAAPAAQQVYAAPSFGRPIRVYRLPAAAPAVYLATGRVHLRPGAPPRAAAAVLADPRFRPGADVVLESASPPSGPPPNASPPRLRVDHASAERLAVRSAAGEPTVLVWQRSRLPLHRAAVDGVVVPVRTVNLFRVGVEVPAGEHRVDVWVDRGPTRWAALASLLGALGLLLAVRWLRRRPAPDGGPAPEAS